MKHSTYVKSLIWILATLFSSTFVYTYFYAKSYPIPLTDRISLDAKMLFIKDMPQREEVDTIILGSSIGLNNIHGPTLEKESKVIGKLLNMSAFSMEVSHMAELVPLFSLFPNLKRVIYSAQSLDFTGGSSFEKPDLALVKNYILQGRNQINFTYAFLAYQNFINIVKRRWTWKKKHLAHNQFENLDYDYTGSAGLHIYGDDIIKRRWNNPFVMHTNKKSYRALDKIIRNLQKRDIKFYFVIEPYRGPLVQKDKKLRKILDNFHTQAKEVVTRNHENFINLYRKLHLDDKYFADRIHLNDTGNIVIAKEISQWIDTNEKSKGKR